MFYFSLNVFFRNFDLLSCLCLTILTSRVLFALPNTILSINFLLLILHNNYLATLFNNMSQAVFKKSSGFLFLDISGTLAGVWSPLYTARPAATRMGSTIVCHCQRDAPQLAVTGSLRVTRHKFFAQPPARLPINRCSVTVAADVAVAVALLISHCGVGLCKMLTRT